MGHRSKCKSQNKKFLEENIGLHLPDFGLGRVIRYDTKSASNIRKNDKFGFIKIKNFSLIKWKQVTEEEKTCKSYVW